MIKLLSLTCFLFAFCTHQSSELPEHEHHEFSSDTTILLVGAERTELYFPLIAQKQIALVCNHTARIKNRHLVDSLFLAGFQIVRIFSPEHGFRGTAEAGEPVAHHIDPFTNIPVISLYGKIKKPLPEHMQHIDIVIYDIQDVGARFYTYISTMHYIMESCAEHNIPLIILDRPNPNGFYVDGPILHPSYQSFVGMHPIPIVHGMTVGELALMINGEKWLTNGKTCDLTVIPMKGYTHKTLYKPPVPPSPNLQTYQSILLYPTLCLFEGTVMSIGRGTDFPFLVFGHPLWPDTSFAFTPVSKPGFAANPPHLNQKCFGKYLISYADSIIKQPYLRIEWLIEAYKTLEDKTQFFHHATFDRLAGNSTLRKQIIDGLSADDIRISWQEQLQAFKQSRKKYLLYPDFE